MTMNRRGFFCGMAALQSWAAANPNFTGDEVLAVAHEITKQLDEAIKDQAAWDAEIAAIWKRLAKEG